jgi:hypothetical protein
LFCFASFASSSDALVFLEIQYVKDLKKILFSKNQCCGSGRFLSGSGSRSDFSNKLGADPDTVPDPDLDPVPDPDPKPIKIRHKLFLTRNLLPTNYIEILFMKKG